MIGEKLWHGETYKKHGAFMGKIKSIKISKGYLKVPPIHEAISQPRFFKVNNRNTRKRCEICLELTMKSPERHQWLFNNSHLFLCFCCCLWTSTFNSFRTVLTYCNVCQYCQWQVIIKDTRMALIYIALFSLSLI